jgi:hypothetical protein
VDLAEGNEVLLQVAAGAGEVREVLVEGATERGAAGLAASEGWVEGVQVHELPELGFCEGAAELGERDSTRNVEQCLRNWCYLQTPVPDHFQMARVVDEEPRLGAPPVPRAEMNNGWVGRPDSPPGRSRQVAKGGARSGVEERRRQPAFEFERSVAD